MKTSKIKQWFNSTAERCRNDEKIRNILLKIKTAILIILITAFVTDAVLIAVDKEVRYNTALSLMELGDYQSAILLFSTMQDYADSSERRTTCIERREARLESIRAKIPFLRNTDDSAAGLSVGDIITLGCREQDNNTDNGTEAIEWQVLDIQNGKATLISRYALACRPFNEDGSECTWETCSLRSWLNGEFYETAFSDTEKARILCRKHSAEPNPSFDTPAGNDTKDRVYLLSLSEAMNYFPTEAERRCYPTASTAASTAYVRPETGTCWWWLRTPTTDSTNYSDILSTGLPDDLDGGKVDSLQGCVRPVIVIRS